MKKQVNTIANLLSLRPPQRESLELLDRIASVIPLKKDKLLVGDSEEVQAKKAEALANLHKIIKQEFSDLDLKMKGYDFGKDFDFERNFPNFCFALATGVGKTRLMGAFIAYLNLAHGIRNFFILAPGLTIYNKLIADFTPNTPKYVFPGIQEYSLNAPTIITGDNYETLGDSMVSRNASCVINIFNVSKINTEVRSGNSPRIKRLSEYIGQSYFEHIASRDNLVMIMDESHRYRGSAGVRSINELNPVLGLELTATPQTQVGQNVIPFKNVLYSYPLGKAMKDGFVKEPEVVTRENFRPENMNPAEVERIKLEDGIRLHEITKVELDTFARARGLAAVKPFVLVIARDTDHAKSLQNLIASDDFFEGRYREKVIQIDYRTSKDDEVVERLLKVENFDEPTEIVIHVDMLKEGWDVKNLYTIIPLRAANARNLVEQSIGRGLRLPYGKRTGVEAVDTVSIVAHDRFKDIVDEASKDDWPFSIKQRIIHDEDLYHKPVTFTSRSRLDEMLDPSPETGKQVVQMDVIAPKPPLLFESKEEYAVAKHAREAIRELAKDATLLSGTASLGTTEVRAKIAEKVEHNYRANLIPGIEINVDIDKVIEKTTNLIIRETIDIPRIMLVPEREGTCVYHPFSLDVSKICYQPVSEKLYAKNLATQQTRIFAIDAGGIVENSLENILVSHIIEFDDVFYDTNAETLHDLARQVLARLESYLSTEEDIVNVVRHNAKAIAKNIHAQMQGHQEEIGPHKYTHRISQGFTELKQADFIHDSDDRIRDFRKKPKNLNNIKRYIFGGFARCLYPYQKFDSDTERILANILDRDSKKWFRPVSGQFMLFYRFYKDGTDQHEYQPDFVAETKDAIFMLEPKSSDKMEDPEVVAKKDAAVCWCQIASEHAKTYGGKPWIYVLIPHDAVQENISLQSLTKQYRCKNTKNYS